MIFVTLQRSVVKNSRYLLLIVDVRVCFWMLKSADCSILRKRFFIGKNVGINIHIFKMMTSFVFLSYLLPFQNSHTWSIQIIHTIFCEFSSVSPKVISISANAEMTLSSKTIYICPKPGWFWLFCLCPQMRWNCAPILSEAAANCELQFGSALK